MAEQPAENLWSIVMSGGKYFLGVIDSDDGNDSLDHVTMYPCYEVTSQLIPVGRNENGMPIMSKNISAEPVLVCFGCPPVLLKVELIVNGADMKDGDRSRYKRLADNADKMCREALLQESGLVAPGGGRLG